MESANKYPNAPLGDPVLITEKYGCILNIDMVSVYSDVFEKNKPAIFYSEKIVDNKYAYTLDLYDVRQTLFFNRDLAQINITFCSLENKVTWHYQLRLSVPADVNTMTWLKYVKPKTGETIEYLRITGLTTESKCNLLQ